MTIEFDSESIYGDKKKKKKCIKTKIKSYGDKMNTNFQGKKIPTEISSYECLSLTMLDTVIKLKLLSSKTSGRVQIHNKK